MPLSNWLISPAYRFEQLAFNPNSQPSNSLQKEVLARIATIAVPFFYAYQAYLHAALALVEAATCLVGITEGNLSKNATSSVLFSIKCLFSSIFEIPHKLVNGPRDAPNYFGNNSRHCMVNYPWKNRVVWN